MKNILLKNCNMDDFVLSKTGKTYRNIKLKRNFYLICCKSCNQMFFTLRKNAVYCSLKCNTNSQKNNIKNIKEYIENEGYTLISKEYINAITKLEIQCDKRHKFNMKWNDFQMGTRCPICAGNVKNKYNDVKLSFEKEGYILVSDIYVGTNDPLNYICPNGHEHFISYKMWKRGQRCPYCYGNVKHEYNDIKEYIEKEGYTLISKEYVNTFTNLDIKCDKGHQYKVSFGRFKHNNARCPQCNAESQISNEEKDLQNFIKLHVNNVIVNDRSIIRPLELDIYLPDYKIAIEYNGLYWHSEQQGKDKNYHLNKTKMCEQQGIQLIQIFSDEWLNKSDIVKSVILSKLGMFNKRYYARKCQIMKIDKKISNQFLDKYHLQGKDNSSYQFGLYDNLELLSVMTFGKRTIGGSKTVNFEMIRFCNKSNVQIVGGASKLLKYLIKHYNISYIKTFADLRYSDGTFYKKIGFKFKHISQPNYFYIIDKKRHHRVAFQKHKIKDKLQFFDSSLTEYQNMLKNGIDRIWDCGNYVFEYNKT